MNDLSTPWSTMPADDGDPIRVGIRHPEEGTIGRNMEQPVGRIILPRRPGESPLAPPSYYYRASKGGVVPSWVAAEQHGVVMQPSAAATRERPHGSVSAQS